MYASILRKCRRCGHRVPLQTAVRDRLSGHDRFVCIPCHEELVEQATGYRQGKLELPDEGWQHPDVPF